MAVDAKHDTVALKSRGIMEQKQPGLFTIRLRVVGGRMEIAKLAALAEILAEYGLDHAHLTTRQGVEIPNVREEDVDGLYAAISAAGLGPAAVGPCVRTITACQGGLCRHGIIDSQRIAQLVSERFSGRSGLPHKFKIAITGCPNACVKPRENDLGIMGVMRKVFQEDLCAACGLCVDACSSPGALEIRDGALAHRPESCVGCGKCIGVCPTGAWKSDGVRYAVFVGGKMGKRPMQAIELPLNIRNENELLDAMDSVIEFYRQNGHPKERFGDTLCRLGADEFDSVDPVDKRSTIEGDNAHSAGVLSMPNILRTPAFLLAALGAGILERHGL